MQSHHNHGFRVIFLDVDGVLNSRSFANKLFKEEGVRIFEENILDPRSLSALRTIVFRTDAIIVLSSSWRMIPSLREALCSQLRGYGLEIHSSTPCLGRERGDEITSWFKLHSDIPVESYVILDDDSDMNVHKPHLIKTSFNDGLSLKHAELAVERLLQTKRKE